VLAGLIVVAGIAGTATAVKKIGTRALRNRAVTTAKLHNAAVTGPKIADGAVTREKVADGAVTGDKVADGSLDLQDVAEAAAEVTFNPPSIGMDACATSGDISVPGMQGTEEILVIPGGYAEGWSSDLFLDAYGASGPGTIRVRVCFYGSPAVNPGNLPLTVLLFRS